MGKKNIYFCRSFTNNVQFTKLDAALCVCVAVLVCLLVCWLLRSSCLACWIVLFLHSL